MKRHHAKKATKAHHDGSREARSLQTHFYSEVRYQRAFVRRARSAEAVLDDLVEMTQRMLADRHLFALMRREGLTNIPAPLADRLAEVRRR